MQDKWLWNFVACFAIGLIGALIIIAGMIVVYTHL